MLSLFSSKIKEPGHLNTIFNVVANVKNPAVIYPISRLNAQNFFVYVSQLNATCILRHAQMVIKMNRKLEEMVW